MNENANDGVRMFAKGGITAALTINSGALIATLSQIDKLHAIPVENVADAFSWWAFGVTASAIAWIFATLAASSHANGYRNAENWTGRIGYCVVIGSIACFTLGGLAIAAGIRM